LIETWQPVLPGWVVANIKAQLLLPRLRQAVDGWDPRAAGESVHVWLLPWLPTLRERLDPLYHTIRHKLSLCLQGWQPSDGSAHALISAWEHVFAPKDMAQFLRKAVAPKLAAVLRELVINPAKEQLEPFRWVSCWRGLMSAEAVAELLDHFFFPKLLATLCAWLSQPDPDLSQVAKWYSGWKHELATVPGLLGTAAVRASLARALDLMSRTLDGRGATLTTSTVPTSSSSSSSSRQRGVPPTASRRQRQQQQPWEGRAGLGGGGGSTRRKPPSTLTFNDLVQRIADEHGLTYMPKPGGASTTDGKTLYSFGKLAIYIERGVVFGKAVGQSGYHPIAMSDLAKEANG
jgi:tuftelin-interacting protein 11